MNFLFTTGLQSSFCDLHLSPRYLFVGIFIGIYFIVNGDIALIPAYLKVELVLYLDQFVIKQGQPTVGDLNILYFISELSQSIAAPWKILILATGDRLFFATKPFLPVTNFSFVLAVSNPFLKAIPLIFSSKFLLERSISFSLSYLLWITPPIYLKSQKFSSIPNLVQAQMNENIAKQLQGPC